MYGFETPEESYTRISRERGWFDETPFEELAATVIEDLMRERNEAETARDEYESEVSYLQDRVDSLEVDLHDSEAEVREQREEQRGQDSEQHVEELETEIEFLKSLVTDMEEELAALDVAV